MKKAGKEILFNDVFVEHPVKFTRNFGKIYVRGDQRLSNGMYRTDEEDKKYREESLARELP